MSKSKGRKEVGKMIWRSVMSCIVLEKLDRYDIIGGNTVHTFPSYIKKWCHRLSILTQWIAPPNSEFIVTEPLVAMIGDGS